MANAYTSEVVATVENLTFMMNIYNENMDTSKLMMFRAVFWVVLPCKMIVDRRFRGTCCLPSSGMNKPSDRRFEVL
jgi:hypothetical protein